MTITSPSIPRIAPSRYPVRVRVGQAILTAVLLVMGLVGLSTAFSDDPFPGPAIVLIASFAAVTAILGVVTVWSGVGSRAVRLGFACIPLFFVWHVAALHTWVPDAGFAVLSGVGVVLVSAAGREAG